MLRPFFGFLRSILAPPLLHFQVDKCSGRKIEMKYGSTVDWGIMWLVGAKRRAVYAFVSHRRWESKMIFDNFSYIKTEALSGDIRADVKNMLLINGKNNTYVHVSNVAERNALISKKYSLDRDKYVIGGLLHDISAIIKPEDMLKYAYENNFDICEAEKKYPFLLHQRLSKICAVEYFNIFNEDILSAIECHTTLKKHASKYEMSLFIADKLA